MSSIITTPNHTTKSASKSKTQMTTSQAGATSTSTSSKAGSTSTSTSMRVGSTSTSTSSKAGSTSTPTSTSTSSKMNHELSNQLSKNIAKSISTLNQEIETDLTKSADTTTMTSTQNTPSSVELDLITRKPKVQVEPKIKAPKKKTKAVLEKEAMEAEMKEMKEMMMAMKAQQEAMKAEKEAMKAEKEAQDKVIEKQNEEYLALQAEKTKKKTGGKPKTVVQHQPHYRFRTIQLEDGDEEILMLDSEVGIEIPLYEEKVEFTAQLEEMKTNFRNEYDDCIDCLDLFDDNETTHDNFGSDLIKGERDFFFLKNRMKYWTEMTKEELINQLRGRHYLNHFRSRNKDDMIEPNWAKTVEGEWVKWGKGTLYGLKKNTDGTTITPKVAVNLKSAEGRKQIKTAPDEDRCEANASKKAGRCCKGALFQIPEDGKYPTRRVCITHMKAVHQTSVITKKPLAFGGRWGWSGTALTCFNMGEGKTKSIDEYCKNKLKAEPFLEASFKQIKGNDYTRDDLGNSNGYTKFKISY